MPPYVLIASSLLTVLLAVAFARERRLRLALQRLLTKLLSFWKRPDEDDLFDPDDAVGQGTAGDRVQRPAG